MKAPFEPGRVVIAKKGRDSGRYFVVLYLLDAEFALIADGDTRKLARPKKKKLKHLRTTPDLMAGLPALLAENRCQDSDLRKALSAVKTQPTQAKEDPLVQE